MMMLRLYLALFVLALSWVVNAEPRPGLEIRGVDDRIATNVRLYLETEADPTSWGSPAVVRTQSAEALRPFGYYSPAIELTYQADRLIVNIAPGPRTRWLPPRLHIAGPAAALKPFRRLLRDHPFQPGDPLSHPAYDTYRERWLNLSRDHGFFDASLTEHQLLIDPANHRATAILTMESGPRYQFGAIRFDGGSIDPAILEQLTAGYPGEPYRRQDLQELHRSLQETGYFGSVRIRSERRNDDTVDLTVALSDAPLDRFTIGGGFATNTGPRGRLRWERPLVNRQGHRFQSELFVSQPETLLGARYLIPLSHPLDHYAGLSASLERKHNEDTETRLIDIGYDIHRRLRDEWRFSYGIHLQNERYQQGSEPERELTYFLPGIRLSQLDIAYGPDPRRGHKTWLELVGSDQSLGADRAFLRARAGHARLWSPAERHLFIARVEAGVIATGDIADIPASQRFFTGGDDSVRGFGYESLSTRDPQGQLTGGRYLNVASLEYSYRFAERWRGAIFNDAGRAFNNRSEPWHQSVGIGVRWLSPVGQVRVDLAVPIDDDRESGWRIHIFLGPPL